MKTIAKNVIVEADLLQCVAVRDNGNATVNLYYKGDVVPAYVSQAGLDIRVVTRYQFERALNQQNVYAQFTAAVNLRPSAEQIYWNTTPIVCSQDAQVAAIAVAMGANAAAVQTFFDLAATF